MPEIQIDAFKGIDQSRSENKLSQGYSPDAENMDTADGDLAVSKGFVKHFATAVPGTGRIHRLYIWHTSGEDKFIVAVGNTIYSYVPADGSTPASWGIVYTYADTITSDSWDFVEHRIGNTDYLIIANGQAQLIKWSGTGQAELFGSGSYVYEGTVASVAKNLVKATNATYDEKLGIYTLTMPDTWTYTQNCRICFIVDEVRTSATTVRFDIGGTLYTSANLPDWVVGDMANVTLTGTATATVGKLTKCTAVLYDEATGTYTATMDDGWTYAENAEVAFVVSQTVGSAATVKFKEGTNTHTLTAVPTWALDDVAVIKLTSTTAAEVVAVGTPTEDTYADKNGRYQLTMPAGWAYEQDTEIAFDAPSTIGTVGIILITIGSNTHRLNYIPGLVAGNVGVIKLTSPTTAENSLTVYGISKIVLNAAISEDWKQRALDIGMAIEDVTYELSEISGDRLTLTIAEVTTAEIEAGNTAKLRGGVSDAHVGFLEIYYSRLFAAGDPAHPSRLYWSQPPGDIRTIEDWSMDDASEIASGGHTDIGNTSSDPIVGLCALSNQLLIFKETSIYRLLGDKPTNYRVLPINMGVERMTNTGRITYADTPHWLTKSGMYYHDGQVAKLSGSARQIRKILETSDLTTCKAAENRNRLYYSCKRNEDSLYDDALIIYDMVERTYMLRTGFKVIDICARGGTLYMINDKRYVYRFGEGDTYDGAPIHAYWRTPLTDLSQKQEIKHLTNILLRGEGNIIIIEYRVGKSDLKKRHLMPERTEDVLNIGLKNDGCAFSLTIRNEAGSYFKLMGGIELIYEDRRI